MTSPRKGTIVHLIDTGGPGGAETVFLRVAAGLQARGWQSVPVVNREAWLAAQLRAAGLEPIILDSKGSLNLGYLRRLAGLIREHQATAVLTHLYGSAIYGSLAGHLTGRPVISVLHGQSDVGGGGRLAWLKSRIVGLGATRLVAVSGPLRDELTRHIPAPNDRWAVIPNGIDTASMAPGGRSGLRENLGISSEMMLVGALGNIRMPKAYDVFLRTASVLAAKSDRYRFVIAGEGSGYLMDELLALRGELGLETIVHFVGMQSDVPAYLGELDIFLSTSSTEGFSIACVEAMACGLPVVATRSGGPEDIVVHSRTGMLCNVGDTFCLATEIERLAIDPVFRRRLGAAGRKRSIEQFGLDAMLGSYESLLSNFRPIVREVDVAVP